MCTLDRLLIKGIRSFSPNNETVLYFDAPLSLIVGHNGAGKTTVIECLKQATTGSLPPNCRNGQSFIHDPQVRCCACRAQTGQVCNSWTEPRAGDARLISMQAINR